MNGAISSSKVTPLKPPGTSDAELNTLNGLILYLNRMLEFDDKKTRDLDTIGGCINKIHDIIAKFDENGISSNKKRQKVSSWTNCL